MHSKFVRRAFVGCLFSLSTIALTQDAAAQGAGKPPLGTVGESCKAKADCSAGLSCMDNVCRDQMEGASCTARADCGTGGLMCIESRCVPPGTVTQLSKKQSTPTPPPDNSGGSSGGTSGGSRPDSLSDGGSSGGSSSGGSSGGGMSSGGSSSSEDEKPREGSSQRSSGRTADFVGIHPHVGMVLGGGPTVGVGGGGSGTVGGFLFALKGGVLIDRIELTLEFSPATFLPIAEASDAVVLQVNANAGYHIPIYENFSWPLRGGIGFAAVNLPASLELRFDVVGISALFGPVLLDLYVPSFRVLTDFDYGAVLHFMFGIGGSILPMKF